MPKTDSPLRYPGGKTKLYSEIQPIILSNAPNGTYIEPFAGGCGLALKLLFNGDVSNLVLNDVDYCIYCFWDACLNHTDELCDLIFNCDINIETWQVQKNIYLAYSCFSPLEVAFATFYLNRCNVSGVIKGGPIGGKEQKGKYLINARFNKFDLINKIKTIGEKRQQISFYNMDAACFMQTILHQYPTETTILNIDPPYVKKGSMLYENSFTKDDHIDLASIIKKADHKWFITYDECKLIYEIYNDYRKNVITLKYSAGQTKSGRELIIYSDNLLNISY